MARMQVTPRLRESNQRRIDCRTGSGGVTTAPIARKPTATFAKLLSSVGHCAALVVSLVAHDVFAFSAFVRIEWPQPQFLKILTGKTFAVRRISSCIGKDDNLGPFVNVCVCGLTMVFAAIRAASLASSGELPSPKKTISNYSIPYYVHA